QRLVRERAHRSRGAESTLAARRCVVGVIGSRGHALASRRAGVSGAAIVGRLALNVGVIVGINRTASEQGGPADDHHAKQETLHDLTAFFAFFAGRALGRAGKQSSNACASGRGASGGAPASRRTARCEAPLPPRGFGDRNGLRRSVPARSRAPCQRLSWNGPSDRPRPPLAAPRPAPPPRAAPRRGGAATEKVGGGGARHPRAAAGQASVALCPGPGSPVATRRAARESTPIERAC